MNLWLIEEKTFCPFQLQKGHYNHQCPSVSLSICPLAKLLIQQQSFHLTSILITMLTAIPVTLTFNLTTIPPSSSPPSFHHPSTTYHNHHLYPYTISTPSCNHPSTILQPASQSELDSNVIQLVSYYWSLFSVMKATLAIYSSIALLPLSKSDSLDPISDFFLIKISSKFLLKSYFFEKF